MRTRAVGLILATATLAVGGLATSAGATAPASTCALTFHVAPGVGSTFVSQIRVRGVTCAKAHFAIGRYEHNLKHTSPLLIGHVKFNCVRGTVAPKSLGISRVSCSRGARQISWRAAYGV